MKKIIFTFLLLLFSGIGYGQQESWVAVQSNPNLSVTTDTALIVYTIPTNASGDYKYSFSNPSSSDTLVIKIKTSKATFYYRVYPNGESYNRVAYWDGGTIFYSWYTSGSGGGIREEFFKRK